MKKASTGYILLGVGALVATGFGIAAPIIYNQKQRQANFDYLMDVIRQDSDAYTIATAKGSALDKNYYKSAGCTIMEGTDAKNAADKIHGAIGTFTNDYTAIESVFKNIANKCQASQIADRFYNAYNQTDMLTYLKNGMSSDNLQKYVLDYISKLR